MKTVRKVFSIRLPKSLLIIFSPLLMFQVACANYPEYDRPEDLELPLHHHGERFENLYSPPLRKSFWGYWEMRLFDEEPYADWEAEGVLPPTMETDLNLIKQPNGKQVTWIGHATALIQYQGINVLTDPVFSDRASPVSFAGPKRVVEPSIDLKDLPAIHYIVISHNHYDHLDEGTIEYFIENLPSAKRVKWVVPLKMDEYLLDVGVLSENIYTLDWWETKKFDGIQFTATPSQHWSGRGLWDRNKVLWAAWYIDIDDFEIWFGGDTGYNERLFSEIGEKVNANSEVDLGIIPIGAYKPRWFMKEQHVDPYEAVKIHQHLGAKQSFGIHWGTFQLTGESVMDPPRELEKAKQLNDIPSDQFTSLKVGETIWVN